MTTFAEQMAADLDNMFDLDEFAQTVSYYNGSTSTDIPAIVEYDEPELNADGGATVTVKRSDVSAPGYRQKFTIDGEVWYVAMDGSRPKIKGDSLVWVIRVTKNERSDAWQT